MALLAYLKKESLGICSAYLSIVYRNLKVRVIGFYEQIKSIYHLVLQFLQIYRSNVLKHPCCPKVSFKVACSRLIYACLIIF